MQPFHTYLEYDSAKRVMESMEAKGKIQPLSVNDLKEYGELSQRETLYLKQYRNKLSTNKN